jgi:hypothetical protein
MSEVLSGYRHKASYADIAVMPTGQREYSAGRGDGQERSA